MAIFVSAAAAFLIAIVLTPLLRDSALRRGRLDIPNERSSHHRPTPRNGGLAIVAGILLPEIVWLSRAFDQGVAVMLTATLVAIAVAAIDERRPLPVAVRLCVQVAASLLPPLAAGLRLDAISLPFANISTRYLALPVTLFWIVGVLNAYNFMDGLNGIASVEAVVAGAVMAMLALRHGDAAGAVLALCAVGAAAGFLPWNAGGSIFMGDVGSTAFGFLFAVLALRIVRDGAGIVEAALPLAPFLLDTGVTLVRRVLRGERFLWQAHRSHYYQLLNRLGWSHGAVTVLWGALAVGCGAIALAYESCSDAARAAALAAVVATHAALFAIISLRGNLSRSVTATPRR